MTDEKTETPARAPDPLFAKLLEASKAAKPVAKKGENTDQKYNYAKAEDVIAHAREVLHEAGLVAVVDFGVESLVTIKDGRAMFCRVDAALRIIDPESGLATVVKGIGTGIDYPGDKAPYKAMTGASKYLYASALGLAFGDDPESDTPPPAEPAARRQGPARGFKDGPQRAAFAAALKGAGLDAGSIETICGVVGAKLTATQIDNAGRQLMNDEHTQRALVSLRELAGLPAPDPTEPDTTDLPPAEPVDAEVVDEPAGIDDIFDEAGKDDPEL